ncbi:MAG: signal peptidase II [Deltaproteobacteria bacterium]|nr:signal peptidase II [Deltaproteobacteria bacterium]
MKQTKIHLLIIPALAILFFDQITKLLIIRSFRIYESLVVVEGFFNIVHVRNRGMAFGFLNRSEAETAFYFLLFATIAAVVLILLWAWKLKSSEIGMILGLSFIIGGAMGNLVDRIRLREVIDFLDFHIGSFHWPAFNVADSAITIGTFWVAIHLLFHRTPSS